MRHNLAPHIVALLEAEVNEGWEPTGDYAPESLAFINWTGSGNFTAVFYNQGVQGTVQEFNKEMFNSPNTPPAKPRLTIEPLVA